MIVLQEIDCSDSDPVSPDDQSSYIRHVKTNDAAAPLPAAAIISQPSHVALAAIFSQPSHVTLAQTASPTSPNVSVDSSETDSVVSMSELAPSGSDFVDLQERTAPDEVLNVIAHSGYASAQVCSLNCMRTLVFVCRTYHNFRLFSFFCAHDIASTHIMFFQPLITGEPSAASLSSTLNDMHRALLERDRENEQLRRENQLLRLQLAGPVALDDQDFLDV